MQTEARTMRMLMQRMPKKWFACVFLSFFVLFLVAVIAGALGPQLYDRRELSSWDCPEDVTEFDPSYCSGVQLSKEGTVFTGVIRNLDRLNQELRLIMAPRQLPAQDGAKANVQLNLAISGRNSEEEEWTEVKADDFHEREIECDADQPGCLNLTVAHLLFLNFAQYEFNVSVFDIPPNTIGDIIFTFWYVNHDYTLYELWWRFVFLLFNFIVLIAFAHRLRRFEWRLWTIEQQWTGVLLFGLLGFNNPFFPLELLTEGWFPIFLNRVLAASFIALLMLFWLVVSDGVRREDADRDFKRFYLPKLVLVGIFWASGIAAFTWAELHELDDPQHHSLSSIPGFVVLRVIGLIAVIAYVFWLVYCACRACGDSKVMPYLGNRIKFFFGLSFFVLIVTIGGIVFGWQLGTSSTTAAEFLSFQALMNLYVFVLAICYTPTASAAMDGPGSRADYADRAGMIRLEEDSYSDGEGNYAGAITDSASSSQGSDTEREDRRSRRRQDDRVELDTIAVGLED